MVEKSGSMNYSFVSEPSLQLLKFCGAIQNFDSFPKALPLDCCFIVSQGVAIGLGYVRLSACRLCRDGNSAKLNGWHDLILEDLIMELLLRIKQLYINLLVHLICLMKQSHV